MNADAGMPRLFSGWRLAHPRGLAADGLPHAYMEAEPGKTLFETIEQSDLPDERTYVLWRGTHTFALLNVYPYTSGHLMVLPKKPVHSMSDLSAEVYSELWLAVLAASNAVREAFHCDGLNVGVNEGLAGGGSQPDHLHVHVVPRWRADTNFMTAVAETRILPQTLSDSWQRVKDAWPAALPFTNDE